MTRRLLAPGPSTCWRTLVRWHLAQTSTSLGTSNIAWVTRSTNKINGTNLLHETFWISLIFRKFLKSFTKVFFEKVAKFQTLYSQRTPAPNRTSCWCRIAWGTRPMATDSQNYAGSKSSTRRWLCCNRAPQCSSQWPSWCQFLLSMGWPDATHQSPLFSVSARSLAPSRISEFPANKPRFRNFAIKVIGFIGLAEMLDILLEFLVGKSTEILKSKS